MNNNKGLNRSLGLQYVIGVVIANIIGSGVYKKVAPMSAELGSSGWVLVAWAVAGLVTICGALCNAEVAGLLANTGGEFAYYKKIYNRFFAFMFGWSLFAVIQTAAISSIAYIFAQSVDSIFHLPPVLASLKEWNIGGVFYPFADFPVKLVAIALIILLTFINSRGVKTGAGVSNAILMMVFAGILIIIVFGLGSGHADLGRSVDFSSTGDKAISISPFFTAMLAAFWAYQGWYSIGFIGGEVKDAKTILPKGIVIGVLIIIITYLLINATYLALLSNVELTAIYQAGNKIAAIEAVKVFWGENGALFISILIILTTLGCTNATILTAARPYYAMAKEGLFFRPVARLNNAQAPVNSLVLQCIWASVLVLSGSFDQLSDMVIFGVFLYYGATALGVFILRRTMPDAPRPYKVWAYPVLPALFVFFCVLLMLNTFVARPREAILGLVLMMSGVPMYFWFTRKNRQQEQPTEVDQ
ncbi:amino acid permease [Flavihumibacter rivuli]|uniref:APC family permease n=1 Tax=Flavihumibacter rivuli TaxID=2838156 RepID=UPI001BDF1A86|nr:amino acid permease [Flavihumibacter rivuli]ULQ57245.1 amino acid permease [Flavihumibacter rivuli]